MERGRIPFPTRLAPYGGSANNVRLGIRAGNDIDHLCLP